MEYPHGFALTFGVELEFLVARVLPEDFEQRARAAQLTPDWDGARTYQTCGNEVRQLIVDKLRAAGIPTNDYSPTIALADYSKWTVSSDGSVQPSEEDLTATVHTFSSGSSLQITPDIRKRLLYVNVEVKSRVLPFNEASLHETRVAVDKIRNETPSFVNSSTGLHVHIGNREYGYSTGTLKNFGTLVSIGVHQMNEIHTDQRLTDNFCRTVLWVFKPKDRVPMRMARLIQNLRTVEEFVNFFHVDRPHRDPNDPLFMWERSQIYNYTGLPNGKFPTIEFRQHTGTLDSDAVSRWVLLCGSLVGLATIRRVSGRSSFFWSAIPSILFFTFSAI